MLIILWATGLILAGAYREASDEKNLEVEAWDWLRRENPKRKPEFFP